jgi:hypothetical protein
MTAACTRYVRQTFFSHGLFRRILPQRLSRIIGNWLPSIHRIRKLLLISRRYMPVSDQGRLSAQCPQP